MRSLRFKRIEYSTGSPPYREQTGHYYKETWFGRLIRRMNNCGRSCRSFAQRNARRAAFAGAAALSIHMCATLPSSVNHCTRHDAVNAFPKANITLRYPTQEEQMLFNLVNDVCNGRDASVLISTIPSLDRLLPEDSSNDVVLIIRCAPKALMYSGNFRAQTMQYNPGKENKGEE